MKEMSKIIVETKTQEYVFSGGGGQLGPDTVGTEQIIDGAVEEQDLHDDVKNRMTVTHDASTGGIRLGGYAQAGNVPVSTGGSGGFNEEMQVEEGD